MQRSTNYNTKQSEAILSYIVSLEGAHVTVGQIVKHFENAGIAVGLTTIYRHLDKLVERGKVQKYTIDGVSGACFQYIQAQEACETHIHLKCEACGTLLHLQCGLLREVQKHVGEEHTFAINPMKTVFYGKCASCLHEG